tara:strand:- start:5 stop:661 length:657 start_codon:yes stop_codon:yes gene_type:complete
MYKIYRNVFTETECNNFIDLIGNRDVQSGKNIYLEPTDEFEIFRTYGHDVAEFDRSIQHDRIIRARNPLVPGMNENQDSEYFPMLIDFMQPVLDIVKEDWYKDATVENCYGVDLNSYPSTTFLEPHADRTYIFAIVMIKNRNLEGGDLVFWERDKHDFREIVSEFIKNKHKPDIRISDLQTGDVFVCYDKPYYHAIEPVVSGVRQTSIIRWDNNDRQY